MSWSRHSISCLDSWFLQDSWYFYNIYIYLEHLDFIIFENFYKNYRKNMFLTKLVLYVYTQQYYSIYFFTILLLIYYYLNIIIYKEEWYNISSKNLSFKKIQKWTLNICAPVGKDCYSYLENNVILNRKILFYKLF